MKPMRFLTVCCAWASSGALRRGALWASRSERPLRAGCRVLGDTNVAGKAHDERGEQGSQAGAVVRLGLVLFFDSGEGVMRQIVREVKISTPSITGPGALARLRHPLSLERHRLFPSQSDDAGRMERA